MTFSEKNRSKEETRKEVAKKTRRKRERVLKIDEQKIGVRRRIVGNRVRGGIGVNTEDKS